MFYGPPSAENGCGKIVTKGDSLVGEWVEPIRGRPHAFLPKSVSVLTVNAQLYSVL